MKKKVEQKTYNLEHMQPDELNELKKVVKEFVSRLENVDNEISLLKEDRKSVVEEYTSKIDVKTLNAVLKILKIEQGVAHKDTFDCFYSALKEVE